jgi:hypothetical protein
VEAVDADHLVKVFHRDVLVAEHSSTANPTPSHGRSCGAAGPPGRRDAPCELLRLVPADELDECAVLAAALLLLIEQGRGDRDLTVVTLAV